MTVWVHPCINDGRVVCGLVRDGRVVCGLVRDGRVVCGLVRDGRVVCGLVRDGRVVCSLVRDSIPHTAGHAWCSTHQKVRVYKDGGTRRRGGDWSRHNGPVLVQRMTLHVNGIQSHGTQQSCPGQT